MFKKPAGGGGQICPPPEPNVQDWVPSVFLLISVFSFHLYWYLHIYLPYRKVDDVEREYDEDNR